MAEFNRYLKFISLCHVARGVVIITTPFVWIQAFLGPLNDVDFVLAVIYSYSLTACCICLLEFYSTYILFKQREDHFIYYILITAVAIPWGLFQLFITLKGSVIYTNDIVVMLVFGFMVGLSIIEIGLLALHNYSSRI